MRIFIFLAILLFVFQTAVLSQTRVYPSTRAQIETPVAINPTNPNNFIGAAITEVNSSFFKIGYYYSTNGGSTWLGSEDFSMDISAGDPVISFDPDGIAYIVFQVKDEKKLYMRKSTDGGVNWVPALGTNATEIFSVPGQDDILDKPWIAISPIRNSNGFFNIYITFTATYYEGSVKLPAAISLLKSTNGGSSFSSTGEFNNFDYHYLGSYVEVGPTGEVFVSYAKAEFTRSEVVSIQAARSTNQGSTFQNTVEIPVIQIGLYDDNAYALKAKSVRADCYPRIAVDRSPYSSGTAYLVWSAQAQEVGGNADLRMIKGSINSGQFSWNTSVISVDGSSGEQWMPAINVNPDGVLSVFYYSSGSNLNDPIYTKLRYSSNGGSNFTELNVGSANGFTITENTFLGDYHGLTSWFGKAYGFWCEYTPDPTYDERQVYFRSLDITVPSTPANYVKTIIDQKDESNQSFEKFSKWNQGQFTYYTPPIQFLFQNAANEVLRAKQDFKQSTYQKYHKWNLDNNVLNYKVFQIQTGITSIISQFKTSQQIAAIQNYFLDAPSLNPDSDQIKFIDPWLIDLDESPYGKRNRGMSQAYDWNRQSPFYPDYTTNYNGDVYKGVFLNQNPTFDPTLPNYSVRAISPQDIQLQHTGKTHRFYFQNWGGTNVEYQYPNQLETGVVFTNENAVATANLKGTQLSNNETAYANNSQRKLVRTDDGWLHSVYGSMGRVWYETSTDNGTTWRLMNNGKPLDSGEGKLPSIDYSLFYDPVLDNFYQVVIVFQENSSHKLRLLYYHRNVDNPDYIKVDDKVVTLLGSSYVSRNANAVISLDHGNTITIVWQHTSDGLYTRSGNVNTVYGISLFDTTGNHLAGTTLNSVTPSIYAAKSGTAATHLSWAQIVSEEQTDIKYARMSGSNIVGNIVTASQGSGFSKNYNPSIIEINGGARICWIGFRDISRDEYKTVFKDPDYWRFWNFDDWVKSVNINKAPNYYAITWGRGNNLPVRYTINSKLSNPQSLSIYGKDVQVCNGSRRAQLEQWHLIPTHCLITLLIPIFLCTKKTFWLSAAAEKVLWLRTMPNFTLQLGI